MDAEDPLDHTAGVGEQTSTVKATVEENSTGDSVAEKLNPSLTGEEIVELLNNLTNTGSSNGRGLTWQRVYCCAKKFKPSFLPLQISAQDKSFSRLKQDHHQYK